eukprot:391212_1
MSPAMMSMGSDVQQFKERMINAFNKYTSSNLFLNTINSFKLSSIKFAIAKEADAHQLINFLVTNNLNKSVQKSTFPVLDWTKDDLYPLFEDGISRTIDYGVGVIAFDKKDIVGFIAFCDMALQSAFSDSSSSASSPLSCKLKHGREMMKYAKDRFFAYLHVDINHIKKGEYFHPEFMVVHSTFVKSGLFPVMTSFASYFVFELRFKYLFGTATTITTRKFKRLNSIVEGDIQQYDMSEYVFEDGQNMQQLYIQPYAKTYGIHNEDQLNELNDSCTISAERHLIKTHNKIMLQRRLKMLFKFYNKTGTKKSK